jgi:hypothetical protein
MLPGETHTANCGVKLQEKLRGVGIECDLVYSGRAGYQTRATLPLPYRQAQGRGEEVA